MKIGVQRILRRIENVLAEACSSPSIKSVIIIGSASRPEDYVEGLSDIGIILFTTQEEKNKAKHIWWKLISIPNITATIMTEDILAEICRNGDPLCFLIVKDSITICGEDELDKILKNVKLRVTENTLQLLKQKSIASLGLALTSFFTNDNLMALNHSYHALRSAIRFKALEKGYGMPISDKQVIEICTILGLRDICWTYQALIEYRKQKTKLKIWQLDIICKAIEYLLREKIPSASSVYVKIRNLGTPIGIIRYEDKAWKIELIKNGKRLSIKVS